MEMKDYVLKASRLAARGEAHEYLREQLGLPGYYGANLDALYDCLQELGGRIFGSRMCPAGHMRRVF